MKKLVLVTMIFFLSLVANSAIIKWDAGGDLHSWADANNWTGNVVPGPSDDVILDNTFFTNGYTVFLPNTPVTIRSIRITPDNPVVPYSIELAIPYTNTITDNAFVTTGTGYTIILDNGAVFANVANVSSGTNLTIADSIRINNGGRYIHRTTSGHASWISKLSLMPGTEDGIFAFEVPATSYVVSLTGRSFGHLQFYSAAEVGPITYLTSGASSLTVATLSVYYQATLSLGLSADVIIHKNLYVFGTGTFDLQNSSFNTQVKLFGDELFGNGTITETGTATPQLQFCGSSPQIITNTVVGSFANNVEVQINNAAGITLQSPVALPYKLIFTSGNLNTTETNILTMRGNATCPGASINSFVNGPMFKIGDDDFVFPVGFSDGSSNIYAPIGMANGSGDVSDVFIAEYKRANPQTTSPFGPAHDPFLNHVSSIEYWTFQQTEGSLSSKKISLDVHQGSFCKNISKTYVSRWDGLQWTYEPSTVTDGPHSIGGGYVTGTIQSIAGNADLFTYPNIGYTIATDEDFTGNPLPVTLVSFGATKLSNTKSFINWELAAVASPIAKFEIQRAAKDKNFETIAMIAGSETNRFYNYTDDRLKSGVNYYRLKMIDEYGTVTYSRIVVVMNGTDGLLLTSLAPSVISNKSVLTVFSLTRQSFDLVIADMQGRVITKRQYTIEKGSSDIELSLPGLANGVYLLTGIYAEGRTSTIKFLKQ